MSPFRHTRLLLSLIWCTAVPMTAYSQTTVWGHVCDASSGEALPYASIRFENTTDGTSSDVDGAYMLETRDTTARIVTASMVGYRSYSLAIRRGGFSEVNFRLMPVLDSLSGAVVRPDNERISRFLKQVDLHRAENDPGNRDYSCSCYSRTELGLTNPEENFRSRSFRENLGFVFDYVDTSSLSGRPYLPVILSETVSDRYHSASPAKDREVISALRISGVDNASLLDQFTGSLQLSADFYNPFIKIFSLRIPSPLNASGELYYSYFIVDSTAVCGRKTYTVHFRPKSSISSPALAGSMEIDASDYALRSMNACLAHGGNANWIRDFALSLENEKGADSLWFRRRDEVLADFSMILRDSSTFVSFQGRRRSEYGTPSTGADALMQDYGEPVTVLADARMKDEEYWASVRPYELTERETGVFTMVESVKESKFYKVLSSIVNAAVMGYYETKYIAIGPYLRTVSYNPLEGHRLQLGLRTTRNVSETVRVGGYVAYGLKDKAVKGGGSVELMLGHERTRKLTLSGKYDVYQLGRGTSEFTAGNLLSSVAGGGWTERLSPEIAFSLRYEHEFTPSVNAVLDIGHERIFSNDFVPMVDSGGATAASVTANTAHLGLRFSKDETVIRGPFVKTYLGSKYPVVTLDLTGGVKGISKGDCMFLRPELTLDYVLRVPPAGVSRFHLNAGHIFGQVPYPFLKIHESNCTYLLDKTAFSCMDYLEFASDSWVTLFWEHNFQGFFLGKIPGVKKLQLREVLIFKGAYGHLSERNGSAAPLCLPDCMKSMGNMPYIEVGAGLSNILRLFRVDAIWRVTHRRECGNFTVNAGVELQF